ncbi:MAG: MBL fold metallo-hydrolase, partial [Flavobacteriaceae bacterium]
LWAQRDFDKVEITSERLSNQVFILYGAGGNIGLAIGGEYAYLIDDQFGPLTEKILSHVKTLTTKPVKFVLNTHWHGDHTGGNENLAHSGAFIVAHENVRNRMSTRQDRGGGRITEPSPMAGWPVITFTDKLTLYLGNGRSMHAMHVDNAHTDGDTYYYFPEDNVLHMGDNFFNGGYPFIDLNSGGDIDGLIRNLGMTLAMVDTDTKIIPGHGKLANKDALKTYYDMLVVLRERVVQARDAGNSLVQAQAMGLSNEWDAALGQGFINAKRIIEFIYKSAD